MTQAAAVVTGVGAVTPLGTGAETLHRRWAAGECGIHDGLGRCREFDPSDTLTVKEVRRTDRNTQLASAAADEAISAAGWDHELPYAADRIGCIVGTGIGGVMTYEAAQEICRVEGAHKVPALTVPRIMPNAPAASIAMRHELRGECYGVVSACAASAQAIGAALRIIRSGEADAVVVGGTEACISNVTVAAFANMGATSQCGISRPFDASRDGFVLGEGAGVLVLETPEGAESRGAVQVGRLIGYGATCDALHLTMPDQEGKQAARAIDLALRNAGVTPAGVDYVNAHGTSTPLNDPSETNAIKRALGARAHEIPISSTKSAIGHLLGASGAVEAVATLLALRARVAPPTLGLEHAEDGLDLNYVPLTAQPLPEPNGRGELVGVSNAFGFGGHNAVSVMSA